MLFHRSTHCSRTTGWVTSELYFWHDTQNWCGFYEPGLTLQPGQHFENPDTKRRFLGLVEATGLARHLHPLHPDPASDELIALIHPREQLEHIAAVCAGGGGDSGSLTPVGPASLDIARLAVGGVKVAIDAVFEGRVDNAYVLCRPPGHHALADCAMGFCLFANAAIGVKYARQQYGIGKVATVDWDVHHGNGTEAAFYDDPSVLTISLHQDRLFPENTGALTDIGSADGLGFNLNIPLPPGSGSGAYRAAFTELVLPALQAFEPEAIFLPSGFDSSALDPLGMQMLSSEDYRWMTRQILQLADIHCAGRVVATHEGGYSATYVPYCGLAVLEEMSAASATLTDPFHANIAGYGGQDLTRDQAALIGQVKEVFFASR